jgi:hypothetical protein
MYRLCISLIAVLICSLAEAQVSARKDSLAVADSLRKSERIPTRFRVGLDVSRLFLSGIERKYRAGEASLDVNRGRLIAGFHLGFAERSISLTGQEAFSSGLYSSLGVSRNLFSESDNILAFGGRFAGSLYRYQPRQVALQNPYTGQTELADIAEGSGKLFWLEFVSTMRVKLAGWIMAGFEIRLKYRLWGSHSADTPYFIPGYGLQENRMSPGFNYFIYLQLPNGK